MAFCINCGKQLPNGAKFCGSCGTATGQVSQAGRQIEYEGTIHKCPNCGSIMDAYESVCEVCGYEIRDRKASNSIRELAAKIQEIEKTRARTKENRLKTLYFGQSTTDTDKRIISLVSSFPIPNSKEDYTNLLYFPIPTSTLIFMTQVEISSKKMMQDWRFQMHGKRSLNSPTRKQN